MKGYKLDLGSLKSNLLLRWAINVEKEELGLRTGTIAASARGLQYHSVATLRVKQWLAAKEDLDFYPSLFRARGANNASASSSFDDSLDYMIGKRDRSTRAVDNIPNPVEMPFATCKTNKTLANILQRISCAVTCV